ncbi:DUF484 family protein [Pseudoalteromonas sp. T1lg65]|uniref:DUF484 family protein n=1 Tax=Pseudoalteromonas sp. T1lg65 TaxID=2077101 RepID=UPI003F7A57F8
MKKQFDAEKEQLVCEYLQQNPDFLLRHPYVLLDLDLHQKTNGHPNLALHQQRVLRDELRKVKQQMAEMAQHAHANELVFKQLSTVQLAVLACEDLSTLNQILKERFVAQQHINACRLLPIDAELAELLASKLQDASSYLGRLSQQHAESLFSGIAVGSVALYKLHTAEPCDYLLAFSSPNEDHFAPSNDNLLIDSFIQTLSLKLSELA